MATNIAGSILGGLGSIANGVNSDSSSQGTSVSDSWGSSGSSNYNFGDSWNLGGSSASSRSWNNAYEWSEAEGSSWGEQGSQNWSGTYGSEATAKDIALAREQNTLQASLWNEAADYNAKQAQLDRDFQERMSNTAYQRAVKDLLAAGLNPILAVGNMGASTPVGAMSSMSAGQAYRANVQADSRSGGSSWGSSGSRSYSRSQGESSGGSHAKSKSWNAGKSHSEGAGGSWSSEGSHSESQNTSESKTRTQLASAVEAGMNAVDKLTTGGSAKSNTVYGGKIDGSKPAGKQTPKK